ncbi:hypothetical protein QFC20_004632 [Naganishia adeliensis]|uniref:Uncharacterized protein n=1 Tax=Naganishia adeliensis TaxID=92952 RepID=A0ACC2VYP3_9TREE|nr:hypothetical protein QFC20_004632 [Naganishia adeliensis]
MEIQKASLTAGFFYIKNHSVDEAKVDKTFRQAEAFFATSPAVKKSVDISKSDNFRGWMGVLTENNDPENEGDLHEGFNLGLDPSIAATLASFQELKTQQSCGVGTQNGKEKDGGLEHGENLWPSSDVWSGSPEFKETALAYYREMLDLGRRMFPLLALALELEETFFDDKTRYPAAIQRLLYYPPLGGKKANERQPGIGASGMGAVIDEQDHTDWEVFTVLVQDAVGGLQVKNLRIGAPYIPGTFVINHRVVPPPADTARYSIPTFWGCDHDVPLIPIPTCVSEEHPSKYEIVTAGAYVKGRMAETYSVGPKEEA